MATKEDLEKGEEHTLARHNDPVAQLLLGRTARKDNAANQGSTLTLALSRGERE